VDQGQIRRERARGLVDLLVGKWRPTVSEGLWGIRIVVGFLILLGIFSLIGDRYDKTVWDSAQLLLTASIPFVIAIVGNRYTQQSTQDDVLQAYLDKIGELLLRKKEALRGSEEEDEVQLLARARTLTTLDALGPERQARVLRFLYETKLIQTQQTPEAARKAPVISLKFAVMQGIDLHRRQLLKGADLTQATLTNADLTGANLTGTDLTGANLTWVRLAGAKLDKAILTRADLTHADLTGIKSITREELQRQAKSLKGATMPDGTKHP
jgi:hypothetical protein